MAKADVAVYFFAQLTDLQLIHSWSSGPLNEQEIWLLTAGQDRSISHMITRLIPHCMWWITATVCDHSKS